MTSPSTTASLGCVPGPAEVPSRYGGTANRSSRPTATRRAQTLVTGLVARVAGLAGVAPRGLVGHGHVDHRGRRSVRAGQHAGQGPSLASSSAVGPARRRRRRRGPRSPSPAARHLTSRTRPARAGGQRGRHRQRRAGRAAEHGAGTPRRHRRLEHQPRRGPAATPGRDRGVDHRHPASGLAIEPRGTRSVTMIVTLSGQCRTTTAWATHGSVSTPGGGMRGIDVDERRVIEKPGRLQHGLGAGV